DGEGTVELVNSGNIADELVSVSTVGFAPDSAPVPVTPSTTLDILPNDPVGLTADFDIGQAATGIFDDGQVVTLKMTLKSGAQLTQSVIVTP
ncbi:MAG: hypothetical protein MN733_18215, partial [Nitrososphaera sp.]|nr:hypothetical protein [Nitrososphaera sp.]